MPKSKSKKWKRIVLCTVVLLLIGGAVGYAFRKKEVPITVQKEKVTRRNLTELVVANGKISPVVQVKISPEVSGEIIALPFKEGQKVKKGDLLVKIRPDNYLASRNSAAANYAYSLTASNSACANLERAELEYKRNLDLHDLQLISDSAFLDAKTAFDVAKAGLEGAKQQVSMAKASLENAEQDLSKTTIYSPLTGTITKLNSELGERVVGTAMMAGTEIMTVSDLNEMETRVDIGEMDVVLIEVGQCARLEVDAFKDRKFKGVVTEIANSAKTSASGGQEATKFEVKIRVQEKEAFRPGMSVTAEVETRSRTNVLTVPIQSVTTRMPKAKDQKTNTVASANSGKSTNAASASGKSTNTASASTKSTNAVTASTTNSANTNTLALADDPPDPPSTNIDEAKKKKPGEPEKPVEVVFLVENGHVKMKPVKRGISDDSYVEITDGLDEGVEVVSGGYKAINRELEDGKMVSVGSFKPEGVSK